MVLLLSGTLHPWAAIQHQTSVCVDARRTFIVRHVQTVLTWQSSTHAIIAQQDSVNASSNGWLHSVTELLFKSHSTHSKQ